MPNHQQLELIPGPALGGGETLLDDREPMVLSDFDYTLCHTYGFDPTTNNHLPIISPELVDAAQAHHIVIATGRRANHPSLPLLWESGLVDMHTPVITENGGTLTFYGPNGHLNHTDIVEPEVQERVFASRELILENVGELPEGQRLIFKLGRTMLVSRLQDCEGVIEPCHQRWLAERIRDILPSDLIQVVDTRASVTIQGATIDKGVGFLRYLSMEGIDRREVYVVGLVDGENDRGIIREANFCFGFSDVVRPMVDVDVKEGAAAAPKVLRTIKGSTQRRLFLRRSI
jgi:hydroxymethylpyrimidine pyrophosphatase-like HAD family hydrolase